MGHADGNAVLYCPKSSLRIGSKRNRKKSQKDREVKRYEEIKKKDSKVLEVVKNLLSKNRKVVGVWKDMRR